MKRYLIVLLLIASTLMLIGCGKTDTVQEEKSIAVSVQQAKGGDIENTNTFSGTTKIKDETSVTVEIGGTIEEMNVELGDKVVKGQTLLKIKGTDIENNIKTAEAALNSAQAAYNDSDITIANTENQLESALENAKIAYEKAVVAHEETKRQYDNTMQLYEVGAVSEDAYKQAQAGLEQSQKSVEQAQASLNSAQKSYDTGATSREQVKAAVEQAQVALETAITNRDKLILKSPVDGVITAKNFNVNEMVTQSQPAFIISSTNTLQIDLNITQADISMFTEGQTVDVIIDGKTVEGTVNYVPTVADSSNSLYKVEVLINNSNNEFKAGMSAEVQVSIEKQNNVITVPSKAILEEDDVKYIYIVGGDNRAIKREVITGIETATTVEIKSGVDADDIVVIGGLSLISDNSKLFPVVKED